MMAYDQETVKVIAEQVIRSVFDSLDLAETAIETLLMGDDDDVFEYTMLVVGTARRCLAPAPPYVFVGLVLHGCALPSISDVDDVVLTILSRGFGGQAAADLEGVRLGLADARRRGRLPEVLIRLAAVAAGVAELQRFR